MGANHLIKTSLVRPTVLDFVDDAYIQVFGAKVSKKALQLSAPHEERRVRLDMMLWDVAGTRGFRESLADTFSHGTRGIFAVCDASDRRTVRDAESWVDGVFRRVGKRPVVLVAVVPDPPRGVSVTEEDLRAVAQKYGAPYFYSSVGALEATNQAFRALGERITGFALGDPRVPPDAKT